MARCDSRICRGNCLPACSAQLISTVVSIALLCLIAVGIYGAVGPFWALPCEFLTGFSAASGIAFVTSIGNLSGFVGPYAVGLIQPKTGNLQGSLVVAGVALLVFATLLLLLPEKRDCRNATEDVSRFGHARTRKDGIDCCIPGSGRAHSR